MQKIRLLFFPLALFLWWSGVFKNVDITLAYFFNHWISLSPLLQNTCAFLNSTIANWLYDAVILAFLIPYILKEHRAKRLLSVCVLIGFTLFCFYFWNRFLLTHLKCTSPSGSLPDLFRLSSVIDWIKVKEFSSASYPGDHGSTICMFILITFYLMGPKMGILAILASLPFALPRIIVGAHWTSDLLLGSLPLALFNLGWFLYTPLYETIMRRLYAFKYVRKI